MNIKKIVNCIFLTAMTAFVLAGCKGTPVTEVTYYENTYVMEHYASDFEGFTDTKYEMEVTEMKGFMAMDIGPHEPLYRGVIYLSEDKAAEILENYEWTEIESPEFNFSEVDISEFNDSNWYESTKFTRDLFPTLSIHYVYFDGEGAIIYCARVT